MASTPTTRTMKMLRKDGWEVAIVERWNAFAGVRQDLLGCIDLLAIREGRILGVQATSDSHISARVSKSLNEPRLRLWLLAGGEFCVIGWGKKGPRGKIKKWTSRSVVLTLVDIDEKEKHERFL